MSDLIIRTRPRLDDDFFLALQYDSTNYIPPFPFDGFQLYLNNDQDPFAVLTVDQKKVWHEKIDFREYLSPGTYTLRLHTLIWSGISNKPSAIILLKVGDFLSGRVYPAPDPNQLQSPPFPEWELLAAQQRALSAKGGIKDYWDEWTVDFGIK